MKLKQILMAAACLMLVSGCEDETPQTKSDPCEKITCEGHGKCVATDTTISCECDDGYIEEKTLDGTPVCIKDDTSDPCGAVDCGHGTCSVSDGNATCTCNDGFELDSSGSTPTCKEAGTQGNPCNGKDCGEHGTCSASDGNTTCQCESGYQIGESGKCEAAVTVSCEDVNCGNGTCVDADGQAQCECESGNKQVIYDGKPTCVPDSAPQNSCDNIDCGGHGTCNIVEENAICSCEDGYKNNGNLDCIEASTSACQNIDCGGHGTCSESDGSASCTCEDGYEAADDNGTPTCHKASTLCDNVDCSGHGTCHVDGEKAVCTCDNGYENQSDTVCVEKSAVQGNGGEIKDGWGLMWDKANRDAASHKEAADTCNAAGARLPTPTEIYRNAGEGDLWTGTEEYNIWSSFNSLNDQMEAIHVADGSMVNVARTDKLAYRCVWDESPRPVTLSGANCNGEKGKDGCLTVKVNYVTYIMDAADRMQQYWFQAAEECRAAGGRLPSLTELNNIIWSGVAGSGNYIWTSEGTASSTFSPLIVAWKGEQNNAYDITRNTKTVTSLGKAYFRCISEPVSLRDGKPTFPQPKAKEGFQVDPLLIIDTRPSEASDYWNAAWDCMDKGGHLASADELSAAIRKGLTSTTTSQILTSSLAGANTLTIKWDTDFIVPYWNLSGNINNQAIAKSKKLPYFCAYRPNREWNEELLATLEKLAGSGEVFKVENIITHYVMNKANDSEGNGLLKDAMASTYRGMMLPNSYELFYVIKRGLPNGSGKAVWTSSLKTTSPSPIAGTLKWKGDGTMDFDPYGNGVYGTSPGSTKNGYRSYISSVIH